MMCESEEPLLTGLPSLSIMGSAYQLLPKYPHDSKSESAVLKTT